MEDVRAHQERLAVVVSQKHEYPAERFGGRGIVICAGGERYFTNGYVCASVLRMYGCTLPIQFWHLGPGEITHEMRKLVRHLDITFIDAYQVRAMYPARILNGWELKPYAIIHSPFEEVLALDADNVAVRNPEYLFTAKPYTDTGAIFWPDYQRIAPTRTIWDILDLNYCDEPEVESGQIVIDKRRCWSALQVTMHLNEWSDFYYSHIHGDKETFHLSWRKLGQNYAMPGFSIYSLAGTMCQHDFEGNRLFQHRNMLKWKLNEYNERVPGFWMEDLCLQFLDELRSRWSVANKAIAETKSSMLNNTIVQQQTYTYCRVGYDFRQISLLDGGAILAGSGAVEKKWTISGLIDAPKLRIWDDDELLCELSYGGGMFHGQWLKYEKMPIMLLPVSGSSGSTAFGTVRSPRKLILRNFQSPGDIVMLTAAVRDLHQTYPGEFETDVRTPCPEIWENNPYTTPLPDDDPSVQIINCEYPLIHRSNDAPYHFIHGFIEYLNQKLGLAIRPTTFHGDIHISDLEKSWYSQVEEIFGRPLPFWIVVAGGKSDFTIKWWDHRRFQQVIDHFRNRILFVQVGESGHEHPPLRNVIDLRGKTDLRQLVRLVYHAQGVLCPVTLMMHLAAAVETRPEMPKNRPCVVIAGGREPPHWEAYSHHQFLHRAGALRCCDHGGCWKSRVVPLGDGDEKDAPEHCCVDVVETLPRCMDLITAEDVIRAIEVYFAGGAIDYLTPDEVRNIAELHVEEAH
ncbi:MAG: hypothetical protein NDI90_16145 [Nitrospira sp. BO4]|jgi:ADP-heptose:LPS heptosyltransferase|nr:hypothetical protein [Nitrospira sp. BO4]